MPEQTKVLIVEDLPTDALLVEHEVREVLPESTFLVVDTAPDFLAALDSFQPDVILSDYSMPEFDGLSALKLAQEHVPDTPFLVITGSINEKPL
ncbi:MAG: response regulator [Desulfovibrionales bacterium]|nr:MAG: response regulator [Desulfovibrionales bacterium]